VGVVDDEYGPSCLSKVSPEDAVDRSNGVCGSTGENGGKNSTSFVVRYIVDKLAIFDRHAAVRGSSDEISGKATSVPHNVVSKGAVAEQGRVVERSLSGQWLPEEAHHDSVRFFVDDVPEGGVSHVQSVVG